MAKRGSSNSRKYRSQIKAATRAFRSLIAGGTLHLAPAAAVLVCWLVGALCVTVLTAHRQRTWSVARLRPARAA